MMTASDQRSAPATERAPLAAAAAAAGDSDTGRIPVVEGVEHRFVEVDGLRMHYAEAGRGEPIVLVHGWPQHWWCWREVIGPLSEHYRVICPDLRGMGWSEGSEHGYSWHAMGRDLIDLLDLIGVGHFRLVGHDWGLVIGYRMCFEWPDRIRQFVALGGIHPWSLDGAPIQVLGLVAAPWHVYVTTLFGDLAARSRALTEGRLHAWRHRGRFTPLETETYMSVMSQAKCANAAKRFDRNVVFHELPRLALRFRHLRSRVQTLHLNGDHDPLVPDVPSSYRKYADDMELELVPDCGHFVAEEQPEWLLERLLVDGPLGRGRAGRSRRPYSG